MRTRTRLAICFFLVNVVMILTCVNVFRFLNRSAQIPREAFKTGPDRNVIRYTTVVSCDSPSPKEVFKYPTILTLVTTMKDIPEKRPVLTNTLKNWSKLMPLVQPVLYTTATTSKDLIEEAEGLGWHIRSAPSTNEKGLPVLASLMQDADLTFESEFIGYANGDLLFSTGILKTLNSLLYYVSVQTKDSILIGVRTKFDIRGASATITDPFLLESIAKEQNGIYLANAEDYIITVKGHFPWHCVPPFVVGRIGLDNWLVSKANRWGFTVIDVSNTLLAVHQTDHEGDFPCMHAPDMDLNLRLIPNYNLATGLVTCAGYGTVNDITGDICIMQRSTPGHCGELDQIRELPSESECKTNREARPVVFLGPKDVQGNPSLDKVIIEKKESAESTI